MKHHHDPLESRLRADAEALRRSPTPDLSQSVLARLDVAVAEEKRPRPWGPVLAAAAAVALLASLWAVLSAPNGETIHAAPGDVVELSKGILSPPLLAQMTAVDDPLLAEARNLWSDTSRAAESVARGLRMPMRLRADND